jgi:hypothetical protein
VARISSGAAQLFVGPTSSLVAAQMKVRYSTRATSDGCERARKLLGRLSGFSRINVPLRTICAQRLSYSSVEPSHQTTHSGWHKLDISATQARSRALALAGAASVGLEFIAVFPAARWLDGSRT